MANFYITLPVDEIARQVAALLNAHNKLFTTHNAYSVINNPATYFIETYGAKVVGCSAIIQETEAVTRQFHLCVDPNFRRRGIARKLKRASLNHVQTPFVYVTVREDNAASIALNISEDFKFVKKDWSRGYYVWVLAKDLRKPNFVTEVR